ncbi:MAG TPA: hypothetical protein DCS90_13975, partial [Ktedonobacter sp.]|nr:hypothetical protein [Ktedonobacter sp.]
MDCLHAMAPNDEELLGFALDEEALSAPTREHLEQCELCQQRLSGYKQVNSAIISQLYRRLCPSGTQLSLYCAELLPVEERTRVASHVLDCPLCTAEVAETRLFMAMPLLEPFREAAPLAAARRIYATLFRQQAQLVLRSGDTVSEKAWPRQYRAEAIDISLHLSRASNGQYILLGILTSADSAESVDAFEGAKAELYCAQENSDAGGRNPENAICRAVVDDLGNIVFSGVPVGEYTLIIHLPGQEVIIEGIDIERG